MTEFLYFSTLFLQSIIFPKNISKVMVTSIKIHQKHRTTRYRLKLLIFKRVIFTACGNLKLNIISAPNLVKYLLWLKLNKCLCSNFSCARSEKYRILYFCTVIENYFNLRNNFLSLCGLLFCWTIICKTTPMPFKCNCGHIFKWDLEKDRIKKCQKKYIYLKCTIY